MGATDIDYLDLTLRTVSGCDKVSEGCVNCYAIRWTHRMACNPLMKGRYAGLVKDGEWTGKVITHPENLDKMVCSRPRRDGKRLRIGVDFYGDLFHPAVPDSWRDRVFATMALCPQHTFMLLTKRAENMKVYVQTRNLEAKRNTMVSTADPHCMFLRAGSEHLWMGNLHLGITAENQPRLDERIGPLMALAAQGWRTWVSLEPCLGPIDMACLDVYRNTARTQDAAVWQSPISFVVVGPETGPRRRPCDPAWLQGVAEQCRAAGVPVWVKAVPIEQEKCPECKGARRFLETVDGIPSNYAECPSCHGTGLTPGKILHDPADPRWPAWAVRQTAAACGKGE